MDHEEIIAMAREVGLLPDNSHPTPETRAMRKRCEVVKHFATLVAAKEREACAQECVAISVDYWMGDAQFEAATRCCNAIRARGQKGGV